MTQKHTTHIEQLFQELVSQDQSFVSQKKDIFWLLERMTQHTPSVSLDPLFKKRLKDNLHYHLISQYTPAPQMSGWQKFLLYGIPSLAIGLALIYVLPILPGQHSVDTVTTTTLHPGNQSPVIVTSDSITTDSTNSATTTVKTSSQSSYQQKNTISSSHNDTPPDSSLDPQGMETSPMMMKTSDPIVWGNQLTTDSLSASRYQYVFYNLQKRWENYVLMGIIPFLIL